MHRRQNLRMLTHAEIIVGAPNNDVANARPILRSTRILWWQNRNDIDVERHTILASKLSSDESVAVPACFIWRGAPNRPRGACSCDAKVRPHNVGKPHGLQLRTCA